MERVLLDVGDNQKAESFWVLFWFVCSWSGLLGYVLGSRVWSSGSVVFLEISITALAYVWAIFLGVRMMKAFERHRKSELGYPLRHCVLLAMSSGTMAALPTFMTFSTY